MSQPYVGEIRMFGGNFAPSGWAFCDGSEQLISENDTLFQLIGTTYGGDGQNTFNLPDLRGRLPLHMGTGFTGTSYTIGQSAGVETVTLTGVQIPVHNHSLMASKDNGTAAAPAGQMPATLPAGTNAYLPGAASTALASASLLSAGGSQPHENRQPFLCVSFIISLYGIYPSPN